MHSCLYIFIATKIAQVAQHWLAFWTAIKLLTKGNAHVCTSLHVKYFVFLDDTYDVL